MNLSVLSETLPENVLVGRRGYPLMLGLVVRRGESGKNKVLGSVSSVSLDVLFRQLCGRKRRLPFSLDGNVVDRGITGLVLVRSCGVGSVSEDSSS